MFSKISTLRVYQIFAPLLFLIFTNQAVANEATMSGQPATKQGAQQMKRLTEAQYRNIIADVFGSNISVGGVFSPLTRTNGLLAVGASIAEDTPASFASDVAKARFIAAQVVDEKNRDSLIDCKPKQIMEPDDACARQFYARVGRMLYRRAMTAEDLRSPVAVAHSATLSLKNFYGGVAAGLTGMMAGLDFRYIVEVTRPYTSKERRLLLDPYSMASRLSFFLWNTGPDETLLAAAEKGELNTKKGLERQIDRLLKSPRIENGVRAFFSDMFGFEDFQTLSKDADIYPAFSQIVGSSAQEQTLRTIVDQLITNDGDYRDLFTTRKTFLNAPLGLIYHVPINETHGEWMPYEFPETSGRSGILTHISFLALHAHPGQSSSTLRGRALRELLLCQRVPDPPPNVNFDLFNDLNSPNRTARERLKAHNANPVCAGCHKLTDPIGFTLENYDGVGQFRATENGAQIDASGELNGVKVSDAIGLGRAMRDNPATSSCLVQRLLTYATGRLAEGVHIAKFEKDFAQQGYRLRNLLRAITLSDDFFSVPLVSEGHSVERSASILAGSNKGGS